MDPWTIIILCNLSTAALTVGLYAFYRWWVHIPDFDEFVMFLTIAYSALSIVLVSSTEGGIGLMPILVGLAGIIIAAVLCLIDMKYNLVGRNRRL